MPLGLLASFAFGGVKRGFTGLWTWLGTLSFWQLVAGGVAIIAIIQHFQIISARHEAAKWHHQFDSEHSGRVADRAAYVKAQAEASAKNLADVKRDEQRRKEISDATIQSLGARLSRLSDELRAHGPAAQSHLVSPGLPGVPNAAGGAAGETQLCLSPAQLLRAAQDEERHDQLIDWIERQVKVDPNK